MLWFFTQAKVYKRSQITMVCRTFFNELKEKIFQKPLIFCEKAYSICYIGTQPQKTLSFVIKVTQRYGKKVASAPRAQLLGGLRIADSDKLETDYCRLFFHRFCGINNNRISETLSLGEKSLSLAKNPFILMGEIWNFS